MKRSSKKAPRLKKSDLWHGQRNAHHEILALELICREILPRFADHQRCYGSCLDASSCKPGCQGLAALRPVGSDALATRTLSARVDSLGHFV
eukprot:4891950-Amphidinium_carterae.1